MMNNSRTALRAIARAVTTQRFRDWVVRYFHITLNNPIAGAMFSIMGNVYVSNGFRFSIPRHLTTLGFRSRFYFDVYEGAERTLVHKYIQPSDCILELGACLGVVSVISNSLLRDSAAHVVVEPNVQLLPYLTANRDNNKAGFAIEHCIVQDGPAQADFYLHSLIVGGSATRVTGRKTSVIARSLEEVMVKHGRFSVIIMDIEGGEWPFISHNLRLLGECRMLIIEEHPQIIGDDKVQQLRRLLSDAGFRLVEELQQSVVWRK